MGLGLALKLGLSLGLGLGLAGQMSALRFGVHRPARAMLICQSHFK